MDRRLTGKGWFSVFTKVQHCYGKNGVCYLIVVDTNYVQDIFYLKGKKTNQFNDNQFCQKLEMKSAPYCYKPLFDCENVALNVSSVIFISCCVEIDIWEIWE